MLLYKEWKVFTHEYLQNQKQFEWEISRSHSVHVSNHSSAVFQSACLYPLQSSASPMGEPLCLHKNFFLYVFTLAVIPS